MRMINIASQLEGIRTVAIAGHVRPDGDCVGSCMGLYLYLRDNYPALQTDVYLEELKDGFSFIRDLDQIRTACQEDRSYDLFITLDASSVDRIGVALPLFEKAGKRLCIDHHVSNPGFGDVNVIYPESSSSCEVVCEMMDSEKISRECAAALYTGIVHDTGVFQYSCTSSRTMAIAGMLMDKGIDFSRIVDESFYTKTYAQNQILGRCLMESILVLDGKCIVGIVHQRDMEFYGIQAKELDGIVSQLRVTKGVEAAVFMYQTAIQEYKVSLRSNGIVDVSEIASYFGGGGHVKAAGCTMQGSAYDVINNLTPHIDKQLKGKDTRS
jgi:phosphoesterase RecJ-like protein